MNHEVKMTWGTPEYDYEKRHIDWYWAVGIITFVIVVISFLYKNYLFAIFILLGMLSLTYFNSRKPKPIMIQVTNRGIHIGNELFLYQNILSFWVEPKPGYLNRHHLFIQTNRFFFPTISIPIADKVPKNQLREILIAHLAEKELTESPATQIMERLGF